MLVSTGLPAAEREQITAVIRITLVLHRHYINAQSAYRVLDAHRVAGSP